MTNERKPESKGQTIPVQGEKQQPSLKQPHERDESVDTQGASEPSMDRIGKVAHDSLEKGQVDTDKGPVLDAQYEKQFRK